jgi:hypothetical protein
MQISKQERKKDLQNICDIKNWKYEGKFGGETRDIVPSMKNSLQ